MCKTNSSSTTYCLAEPTTWDNVGNILCVKWTYQPEGGAREEVLLWSVQNRTGSSSGGLKYISKFNHSSLESYIS